MLITFTDEVARRNIFFLLVGCFVQEFVVHCLFVVVVICPSLVRCGSERDCCFDDVDVWEGR